MAETPTPEQKAYDDELARINAMPAGTARVRAKEDFDAKYPEGRPGGAAKAGMTVAEIAEKLGLAAALLSDKTYGEAADPFMKQVFDLFDKDPIKAREILNGKTKFGKLNSTAQIRYINKLQDEPTFLNTRDAWVANVAKQLKQKGIPFTEVQLQEFYLSGKPESLIINDLVKGTSFTGAPTTATGPVQTGTIGGTAGERYNRLVGIARRNGVSVEMLPKVLGFDTVDAILDDLEMGSSLSVFEQRIRNYAKTAMPDYVKGLLDQGQDLQDIVSPYVATYSDELEVPYTSVDVTNRYLQDALAKNMNLSDFRRALRKDPSWAYTNKAKQETSSLALQVLRDFGFQG